MINHSETRPGSSKIGRGYVYFFFTMFVFQDELLKPKMITYQMVMIHRYIPEKNMDFFYLVTLPILLSFYHG